MKVSAWMNPGDIHVFDSKMYLRLHTYNVGEMCLLHTYTACTCSLINSFWRRV